MFLAKTLSRKVLVFSFEKLCDSASLREKKSARSAREFLRDPHSRIFFVMSSVQLIRAVFCPGLSFAFL